MSNALRMEIELDGHTLESLTAEAERLGVSVEEIVRRATAAWLIDIAEALPTTSCKDQGKQAG